MAKKAESKELKKLEKKVEEWKNKYFRALADYQNLEKRTLAEREEQERSAAKNFILKLLPVIDDFERAEKILKNEGLSLTLIKLKDILKAEKVEKINVLGKKFDPTIMECVEVKETDKKREGMVLEEILAGYKMRDKVVRVARVKVGKGK